MALRGGNGRQKWLMQVVALYDHQPEEVDELEFFAGDVLRVLQIQDDGWWYGFRLDDPDQMGVFPSNYVRKQTSGNPYDERYASTPTPGQDDDEEQQQQQQQQQQDDDDDEREMTKNTQWRDREREQAPDKRSRAVQKYSGQAAVAVASPQRQSQSQSHRSLLKHLQENLVKAEKEKQQVQEARARVQSDLERRRVALHSEPRSEEDEEEEQEQEVVDDAQDNPRDRGHRNYLDEEDQGQSYYERDSREQTPSRSPSQSQFQSENDPLESEPYEDERRQPRDDREFNGYEDEDDDDEEEERHRHAHAHALETSRRETAASRICHYYRSYQSRCRTKQAHDRKQAQAKEQQRRKKASKTICRVLQSNARRRHKMRQESRKREEEAKAAQDIQKWFQRVRVHHQEHQVALETAAVVCIQRWARQMIRYKKWKRQVEKERRLKTLPAVGKVSKWTEPSVSQQPERILVDDEGDDDLKKLIREIVQSQLASKLHVQDAKVKELQGLVGKLQQVIQKQSEMIQESSEYIMEMETRRLHHSNQHHYTHPRHSQQQEDADEGTRSQNHHPMHPIAGHQLAPSKIPSLQNAKVEPQLYRPIRPDQTNNTKLPAVVHSQSHRRVGPTNTHSSSNSSLSQAGIRFKK